MNDLYELDLQELDMAAGGKGMKKTLFKAFKDGENVKNKIVKRGYLNKEETNILMMLGTTHQLLIGVRSLYGDNGENAVEKFIKNQMITKEQAKNLRMAITYQKKFLDDFVENNLDRKNKEVLAKRLLKWELRLVDDYQVKKLDNMLKKNGEHRLTSNEFFSLIDGKLYAECKGCTKERQTCKLRDFLEDNFIPSVVDMKFAEENKCNCEYAY